MKPNYSTHDPKGWGGDPRRGAALGRPTCGGAPNYSGKLFLRRVRLNSGGYDGSEARTWCVFGIEVSVQKVALTMDQVRTYKPPPNPAKMTDVRAPAYVAKYGNNSWEVDAFPPQVLNKIVRDALDELVDIDLMNEVKEKEEEDKKRLRAAVKELEP